MRANFFVLYFISRAYAYLLPPRQSTLYSAHFFDTELRSSKLDELKEAYRKERRTVYTASDWKRHRSSDRYVSYMLSMPRSHVLRGLTQQILIVTINAILIVLYNKIIEYFKFPLALLQLASLPFSLTANALGLLLVFRTNAAYSRWKDSRIAWATITSRCKSLTRQTVCWFPDKDKSLKAEFLRHVVAFASTLKWSLRHPGSDNKLKSELGSILTESEIEDVLKSKFRVHRITIRMSEILRRANLLPNVQCHVDRGISDLVDSQQVCERIFTTPIPIVYTRHTARFLFLWLLTLPMSLYREFVSNRWAVIPVVFVHSVLLFGIEELGVLIEEPFSILALDAICHDIQDIAEESLEQPITVSIPPPVPIAAVADAAPVTTSSIITSSNPTAIPTSASVPIATATSPAHV